MKSRFLLFILLGAFAALSMDTPKLSRKKIYDGVSILMPEDFVIMSDNDIAFRYPSTKKPLAMYISSDTKADFGMNTAKPKFRGQDIKMLHQFYKATIIDAYQPDSADLKNDNPFKSSQVSRSLKFISDGTKIINKKEYAFFEYLSEFQSIKKYNYALYSEVNGQILIFNFVCDQRVMNIYQPIAQQMMASVKVSKNVRLPSYVPEVKQGTVRKRQTAQEILEMQNKNKSKGKK